MKTLRPYGVKLPDGSIELLPLAYLYPAYLCLPKELVSQGNKGFCDLERNPGLLIKDTVQRKVLREAWFYRNMINSYAYFVWPFIEGNKNYMEIYSGYDPIWQIAHNVEMWVEQMTLDGIIPFASEIFSYSFLFHEWDFISIDEMYSIMSYIVPRAIERCNLKSTIDTVRQFRCFEDYDARKSREKADFRRKWYHTRTKHPQISLEEYVEANRYDGDGLSNRHDLEDYNVASENSIISRLDTESFMSGLTDKDREILQLRLEGRTYEEIAAEVGFKTHSAVLKRIKKIGEEYQKFSGDDLGF